MTTGTQTHLAASALSDAIAMAFRASVLNDDTCRRELAGLVRPDMICPACKVSIAIDDRERLYAGRDLICKECGRRQNVFSGTIFCGLHLSPSAIVTACLLRRYNAKLAEIARITGASESTISRLLDRLSAVTVAQ